MGLFYVKTSHQALDDRLEMAQLKRNESNIHVEHEPCEHFLIGAHVFVAHYPIANYFYQAGQTSCQTSSDGKHCVTLIQGYCYEREPKTVLSCILDAASIAKLFHEENYNIDALRKRIAGEYAIVHVTADGQVYAFNDIGGMEHIYFSNKDGHSVLTNRIALIEIDQDRTSDFDFESTLSLPVLGFMSSDGTYLKSTKKMRQDHYLHSDGHQITQTALGPHFYHFDRIPNGENDPLFGELLERGIAESVNWLRFSTNNLDKIRVAITGGKDSRAVLALCLMAGLKDRIELFTNGTDDNPEVIVGRQIAKLCGIPHKTNPTRHPTGISPVEFHRNFAVHAYQSEGLMTPWDIQNRGPYYPGIQLGGMCGEYFRPFKKPGAAVFQTHPIHTIARYFDPLDVVADATKSRIAEDVMEGLAGYKKYGAQQDDLPNIYHMNTYAGWYGSSLRLNSYAVTTIKPLYSYFLNNLAFGLPAEVRSTEIIHYSIIEKCYPKLLEVPFYMQRWDKRLKTYGKEAGVDLTPLPRPESVPTAGSWQNQFNTSASLRRTTAALLNEHKSSEFWEYVDLPTLQSMISGHDFQFQQLHSLFSLLGAFYKSEKIEIPRRFYVNSDKNESSNFTQIVSNNSRHLSYSRSHNDHSFNTEAPINPFVTNEFAIRILQDDLPEIDSREAQKVEEPEELESAEKPVMLVRSSPPRYAQIVKRLVLGPRRAELTIKVVQAAKKRCLRFF